MKTKPYQRNPEQLEHRRRKGIELLKTGLKQSKVAATLDVSRQAVQKWWKAYKNNGISAISKRKQSGRPPALSLAEKKKFLKVLAKGPTAFGYTTELWTTGRIAKVLANKMGVFYHRSHMWKILVSCGWSCQKPAKQASERDAKLIQRWVAKEWPRIKKKPSA
ncbi:MAG: helix-turn-helix domain-containing protein [Bacteroidota bacterium]